MTERMSDLAQKYGRVWDADAPTALVDEVFIADVVAHNPQPGQRAGREGVRDVISLYHGAFPDLRVTNEDIVVSGDRAVLLWSGTGTHEGDQLGIPATHRMVRFTGIDILRVEDGQVAERWGEANGLEMMQQLGSG